MKALEADFGLGEKIPRPGDTSEPELHGFIGLRLAIIFFNRLCGRSQAFNCHSVCCWMESVSKSKVSNF